MKVFDARRGAVVRTVRVGRVPAAVAVDPRTDRVVVANGGDASVSVLDARRGAVLRAVAVGAQPLAVAVDARTGRAFVVNYGGTVREPATWSGQWLQRLRRWLPWLPQSVPVVRSVPGSVSVIDVSRR